MQRSSIGNGEKLLSDFCGNLTGVLLLSGLTNIPHNVGSTPYRARSHEGQVLIAAITHQTIRTYNHQAHCYVPVQTDSQFHPPQSS